MFVDTAVIRVQAGNGGNGCVSFYRGKRTPMGGPNGGDGGHGANVYFVAEAGLNTLIDFRHNEVWKAEDGENGRGKQQYGAAGEDRDIRVPPGTLVYDNDTGELLADIGPDDRVLIARGGRGGFGNEHFKNSVNQAPRKMTPGAPGESFNVRLELKLIAEIGLVGMPNAGKSTLLTAVSRAEAKVGAYPFTTLSPQLGIATLAQTRRLVFADIPGLIAGAAEGAGLGHEFLRHVERCSVLLHLLDAAPTDGSTPAENYTTIRAELEAYSPELGEKPEIIALNKIDLLTDEERDSAIGELCSTLRLGAEQKVLAISGATGLGMTEMLEALWGQVHPHGGGEELW